MKLSGKNAIVTGAARGIGRAYALRLAALGADVAIVDADLYSYKQFPAEAANMTGDTTADEISALGRRSFATQANASHPGVMEQIVSDVVSSWGSLDIVVCNAGGGVGTLDETRASLVSEEMLKDVVEGNLYSTIYTCKAASVPMKQQKSGRIVTVASTAARRAASDGGYAHYGAAKAGVVVYTRDLAQELGPFGVTVNCIAPGVILTGRIKLMHEVQNVDLQNKEIALRRLGTPEDCANILEFLTTNLGDYVTGVVIPVDGGTLL